MKEPITFEPAPTIEAALARAAALWGIELDYWDIWGKRHITPLDVIGEILESLGVRASSIDDLNCEMDDFLWREWSRLTPPTLVIGEQSPESAVFLNVPEELDGATADIEVRWEDGARVRIELRLGDLPVLESAVLRGRTFRRRQLPLPGRRLGYHDVEVRVGSEPAGKMRLIIGPERAYRPAWMAPEEGGAGGRAAGIAISLYGLRSTRNWGCGDLADLRALIDWVVDQVGASFVALNPLHALHNRLPYNCSPYLPNCTFYRNSIYLDIEAIEDFRASACAQAIHKSPAVEAELASLRSSTLVEYERVHRIKMRFLRLLFRGFLAEWRAGSARALEFRRFVEEGGELLDRFAVYSALDGWIHKRHPDIWVWTDWPADYQDPDSEATRRFAREHWRSVLFHKYVQWQLDLQLAGAQELARRRGLSIGLYHDVALATDRFGCDLWAHRDYFVAGCRVGSPPDGFAPLGQDWAFPPPHAARHRENGYRVFVESIRRNAQHGGALRIDHVMRFFRLYWIPEGRTAAAGVYVRDFHEDLLRILALESVRQRVIIVGEDLGTVAPEVRETLERFGILSCRLFYFEKNENGAFRPPHEYPRQALVSASTHDLPTLAGFWSNRDIEARHDAGLLPEESYREQIYYRGIEKQRILNALLGLGLLPAWFPRDAGAVPELTGELHNAIIGFLVSTPSALMVLNEEDLTKETEQQNLPGSITQYPNWRRKMKFSMEDLRQAQPARDFAVMFRRWLEITERLNRPLPESDV